MLHLRANLSCVSPWTQVGHLFLSPEERGTQAYHPKIRFSSSVPRCVCEAHDAFLISFSCLVLYIERSLTTPTFLARFDCLPLPFRLSV